LVSQIDQPLTSKIKQHDKQRLLRAYEVFNETGKTLSDWQKIPNIKAYKKDEILHINMEIPRDELYQKINERFVKMIEEHEVIKEVSEFLKKYPEAIEKNYAIATTLGFIEIKDFIEERISYEKMIELSTQKTRNYAKRQLTWFRNQFEDSEVSKLRSIDSQTSTEICKLLKK
jgi:tRNA dimethylallyltransferase